MTPALKKQCIWEAHVRNITVLLSGYPQPSVTWSKGDGGVISPDETAFKEYLEPYWENGRADEWMANLEVRVCRDGFVVSPLCVGSVIERIHHGGDYMSGTSNTIIRKKIFHFLLPFCEPIYDVKLMMQSLKNTV